MKRMIAAVLTAGVMIVGGAAASTAAVSPVVQTQASCYDMPIGFLVDGKFVWNPAYIACVKGL